MLILEETRHTVNYLLTFINFYSVTRRLVYVGKDKLTDRSGDTRRRAEPHAHSGSEAEALARRLHAPAGARAGEEVQPPALPVRTGARAPGQRAAPHRDPGEDLVPEPTLQNQAEAAAGLLPEVGGERCRRSRRHGGRGLAQSVTARHDVHVLSVSAVRVRSTQTRRVEADGVVTGTRGRL